MIKVDIKTKDFDKLTNAELARVSRLTLDRARGSEMQDFLDNPLPNCKAILVRHSAARPKGDNQEIIAWALLKPSPNGVAVQVYVKAPYRRKGIGTALVARAKRVKSRVWPGKQLEANSWNYVSGKFFKSVKL